MLRESSMPYSSLPQEEDGAHAYVTTRTAGEARSSRGRILSIIVALLLVCGVPLLIIAPLALTRANGRAGSVTEVVNWGFSSAESSGKGSDGDTAGNDNSGSITNKTTAPPPVIVANTPPKVVTAAPPVKVTAKPTTTSTTTTTTTTTPTTTTTTSTTTTEAPPTEPPVIGKPNTPELKPTEEEPAEGDSGESQTGIAPQPTKETGGSGDGGSDENNDSLDLPSTPTQNIGTLMNNFLAEHEWWTLVGLAVAVALAISLLIVSVAWIIQRRLSSSRRRTNLQKVITDLQSRDKVVLLNSEDSEEEA